MNTEQLPDGLQQTGINSPFNACMYRDDCRSEHAQRLTLQHHACDQAQRIADLETKCVTLKRLHDAAADERDALAQQHRSQHDADSAELRQLCADRDAARKERDALRVKHDELLTALHGIGKALGIPECERSPYSVTCGTLERVNRLAKIEAQEPVALVETSGNQGAGIGWSGAAQPVGAKLYARPVPAQAVPTGPRQAVLLTDEQILSAMWAAEIYIEDSVAGQDRASGRCVEAAVLAANGLEVRRG